VSFLGSAFENQAPPVRVSTLFIFLGDLNMVFISFLFPLLDRSVKIDQELL